jgi:hypothetical protein
MAYNGHQFLGYLWITIKPDARSDGVALHLEFNQVGDG